MKIDANEISAVGKAYGLMRRAFIAVDSSYRIVHLNLYAKKIFGFKPSDIGQSLIQVWEEKGLPVLIDNAGKMHKKCIIQNHGGLRQWKKISARVGKETWYFFVDEDVTEKEKVRGLLMHDSINIMGRPYNPSISTGQFLIETRNYLTGIIDKIPCIVYWKNKNLQYIGCNQMAADFLHVKSMEEIIVKTDFDLFPDRALAKSYREIDQKIISDGISIINEAGELVDDKGERFFTLVSKVPIKNQLNEIVGVLGITLNVTREKQAEIAKDDFISNMEHDLRTPFAGIGGVADLLHALFSEKYPELKELLGILVKSCNQWQAIHNRIFDALDLQEGLKIEKFYIQDELEKIQDLMLATSKIKQVEFIIDCPDREHTGEIKTDKLKLNLILSSLIGNAFNFTDKGSVCVKVNHVNSLFMIEIVDTGIGIPGDKIDNIFEKFTKLSRSNTYGSVFKGMGMGLYNARQDAAKINGTISVKSRLGYGSNFILSLPG